MEYEEWEAQVPKEIRQDRYCSVYFSFGVIEP